MVKTIEDYYEEMYKLYPNVSKRDIQRILRYGWISYYKHNSYGGDVLITDSSFWCYTGQIFKNSLKHFKYYLRKLKVKLKVLYKRKKIPWDGYYYFALNQVRQTEVENQKHKRGRKRKYFDYGNVILYDRKFICDLDNPDKQYIYRVPYPMYTKCTIYKEKFVSGEAELIEVRDTLKFKDILVMNNDYGIL